MFRCLGCIKRLIVLEHFEETRASQFLHLKLQDEMWQNFFEKLFWSSPFSFSKCMPFKIGTLFYNIVDKSEHFYIIRLIYNRFWVFF